MIIYALIARGSLILAEYSAYKGDFTTLARKILTQSKPNKSKKSYVKDGYVFTYFSEDDFTFLCLNKVNVLRDITYRFLDQLAELFFSNQGKFDQNSTIKTWGVNFSKKMKELIEDYEDLSPELYLDTESHFGNGNGSLLGDGTPRGRGKKFKPLNVSKGLLKKTMAKKKDSAVFEKYKSAFMVIGGIMVRDKLIIVA